MTVTLLTVDAIDETADGGLVATLVTDAGERVILPLALLPDGTREGDVVRMTLERDVDETAERRRRVVDLQKRLFG
ncbi:MAG TPA: DUF3006 domain-containing protein [Thermomicrobiales bacterium]|nr:DUF3006 domain-containing protein [Thermomicrobiales bacterium]